MTTLNDEEELIRAYSPHLLKIVSAPTLAPDEDILAVRMALREGFPQLVKMKLFATWLRTNKDRVREMRAYYRDIEEITIKGEEQP